MTPVTLPAAQNPTPPNPMRQKAEELEAAFLAEMLGYAGLGQSQVGFDGGIGEEQFTSFLRQEQAAEMVRSGGIGLAESLFHALTEGDHAQ